MQNRTGIHIILIRLPKFLGILKCEDGESIEIAIKAPKVSTLSQDSLNDFYEEANTAITFMHENVLKCLGISDGKY